MTPLLLLCTALGALAHGDHSFDLADQTDSALSYAERHVRPPPLRPLTPRCTQSTT